MSTRLVVCPEDGCGQPAAVGEEADFAVEGSGEPRVVQLARVRCLLGHHFLMSTEGLEDL